MTLPENIVTENRQQVAAIAQAMLDGRVGIIEGSRQLASLSHRIAVAEFDPDFTPFIGIASETSHLPVGAERQLWAADALARKDIEIHAAEEHWREWALATCRRVLERFPVSSSAPSPMRNA